MENTSHKTKDSWYYNVEKSQIASLIPQGPHVVFDLGCGTGLLGRRLLEQKKAKEVIGAEIFRPAAEEAERCYSKVHCGDVEDSEFSYEEHFDFVICGDILEHLRDPWSMLLSIHKWLKSNGKIICSIPNIRYWRIITELSLGGMWEYRDAGILDRTHLRFFTRSSFSEALQEAYFEIESTQIIIRGPKKSTFNVLTLGLLKEFLGTQIIFTATKQSNLYGQLKGTRYVKDRF